MISETQYGAFRGGKLIQQKGQIGGARSVFVKVKGIKNELVYPPFGGKIMNPPKGQGFKMFAGDLAWFKTDNDGIKPEVYLLKTYEVKSASSDLKTVNIVKDGYRHRPFVGDKLGVAPNTIGDSMTAATIVSITTTKVGDVDVYACVFDSAVTGAAAGKILVEADSENKMLVKKILSLTVILTFLMLAQRVLETSRTQDTITPLLLVDLCTSERCHLCQPAFLPSMRAKSMVGSKFNQFNYRRKKICLSLKQVNTARFGTPKREGLS